jgi:outer membrane protein TolC
MITFNFAVAAWRRRRTTVRSARPSHARVGGYGARIFRVASVIAALTSGSIIYAAESPLTLAEAQRLATARSAQIEAGDSAISASKDMAVAAAERPDPVVKFGVDNLPVNGPDRFSVQRDFMTMRTVGVTQEITRPTKLRLRAERSQRAVQLAEVERTQALASVQRDTAVAWLERYYAEAMEQNVLQQVHAAQLEESAAEAAYREGKGIAADAVAARGLLAQLEDQATEASRQVRSSKIALTRWIGTAADWPLAGQPAIDAIPLHHHTLESQLADHPEILALQRQEELARSEVDLARANRHPDWTVELMYSQRGAGFSNLASLEFSLPLQVHRADRQDRELAAKLAEASKAKAEREDMLRTHVAEIDAMIDEWDSARQRCERYVKEIIPLAADRTSTTSAAYRGGKTKLADVLAARRNEVEVRFQALQIEARAARLWAELRFISPADADATATASRTSGATASRELP